jgi:Asp-tRNA(Asn)/Glu-tRNA(Gln) amidotransferase B subunit
MCDADMTLITYNWINNHYQPHPNFNVQHKCRDFDAAMEWTIQRRINASSLEQNYFTRPEEAVVEFDEPPFDPLANA